MTYTSDYEMEMGAACNAEITGDDGREILEVGDMVYPLRCDYEGDIYAQVEVLINRISWTCPKCGTFHEDEFRDAEEPDDGFDEDWSDAAGADAFNDER